MRLPLYHLDAFAHRRFAGNPAAVVPLDAWLPDDVLQGIAAENNLAETAFFVPLSPGDEADFHLRWMTPLVEVDLCGHATLAAAWVIGEKLRPGTSAMSFRSRSGVLRVEREGHRLVLDFPAQPPKPVDVGEALAAALGARPRAQLVAGDVIAVFDRPEDVRALTPDLAAVAKLPFRGAIATAPGDDCDFVSRFFGPAVGIPEDPVTGSAHCELVPYWAERLGKRELFARQISARGGELWCELRGDRVRIGGRVFPYLEGTIDV